MAAKNAVDIDMERLREVLPLIPDGKRVVGEGLLTEIEFLSDTLKQLRTLVGGGSQEQMSLMSKKTVDFSALRLYNATVQRYLQLFKDLCALLPVDIDEADELTEFINRG